jgi:hypothetical protein
MLRKGVLLLLAVAVSFGLTAFSGYVVYANSAGTSEANLSLVVRFAISPIIAILIGIFVGFLSKDRPVLIAVLGSLPWTFMFLASPHKPTSLSAWAGWLAPLVIYLPLAATTAWMAWRYRCRASGQSRQLA